MNRLKSALVALALLPASVLAMAPDNQVFRCDINPEEVVYVTLDQGLLTYMYQNASDPSRNIVMPTDGTNDSLSLYHNPHHTVDGMVIETIRISFHAGSNTTVISMDMSPEDEAFSIPTIQMVVDGKLEHTLGCLYDSPEMFRMRTALEEGQVAKGYSVDKLDPIAPK